MPKLTKRLVDAQTPRDKPFFTPCSTTLGFKLRTHPSGRKAYYFDFHFEGARHKIKIGDHGPLSVEQARDRANRMRLDLIDGKNPASRRAAKAETLTVAQLCERYLEDARSERILTRKGKPKAASTLKTDAGRINRHIIPLLGAKPITALKPSDVAEMIVNITEGKTATDEKTGLRGRARVTGGAGTAKKAARLLSAVYGFAMERGLVETNPCLGLRTVADGRRDRRLSADEFRLFGAALRGAEIYLVEWRHVKAARLCALTGWRLGEIESLRWDALDLEAQTARLERTKSGRSVRPLGAAAVAVLRSIPRAGPFVFPSLRGGGDHYAGLGGGLDAILKHAPDLERFTAHILRHSFASVGADLEISDPVIGQILGHSSNTVTSRYIHRLDATLISAADRIAAQIAQWLDA